MTRFLRPALFPLLLAASPALAADLRPFCATRPSLGAGACVMDVGHAMLEVGAGDWQREKDGDERTDTLVGGDLLLRYGFAKHAEVQIGWTAVGRQWLRDADGRHVQTRSGDAMIAIRRSLVHPDGEGFNVAVQPFVTVPVGRMPIGGGVWAGGAIIPVGYQLSDKVQIQFTGEVDAAADEAGTGRHLAYSGIAGLAVALSDAVSTTTELFVERDRDPDGHHKTVLAAFSGGYQMSERFQVDGGTAIGLNAMSPDVRLFFGFSRRF
jgi:hypothetical protein